MATAYTDQVQKVYIAYYGRAADPVGLAYWAAKVETDGLAGIMASFGASAEATTLYGSLTNTAKVNALYKQSFGRDADFAGLMYYAGQLTAGTMTAASIAQNIFDGATGTDATILTNKLAVAKAYTLAVDTAAEVVAYSGTVAAASARALLTTVDAATVTASFDVATSVASIVSVAAAVPAVAGTTTALTKTTDTFVGTSGNDLYNSVISAAGASGTTVAPGDSISGGAGVDTLALSIAGSLGASYTLSAVSTTGVEKVMASNFEVQGARNNTIDTSLMTGLTHLGLSSSAAEGDTLFTNVKNIVTGELNNGAADLTLTYGTTVVSGTADAQVLNVSNLSSGVFTSNGIESMTVNGSLVKSTLAVASDAITSLTLTGDQALTLETSTTFAVLTDTATVASTIDASALTGKLDVVIADVSTVKVTGGSANDTIRLGATLEANDEIDGGAGTDTVVVSTSETAALATLINIEAIEMEGEDIGANDATLTVSGTVASTITNFIVDYNVGTDDEGGTIAVTNMDDDDTITVVQAGSDTGDATDGVHITATAASDTPSNAHNLTLSGIGAVVASATTDTGISKVTFDQTETLTLAANKNSGGTVSANGVEQLSIAVGTGLNITGAGNLDVDSLVNGDTLTSIDASAMTGTLTMDGIDASALVFKGSAGVNAIGMAGLNASDQLIGGAATTDKVTASAVTGLTAATGKLNIQDLESVIIQSTGANTFDTSLMTGVTSLAISGANPGTQTVTNVRASGLAIAIGDATDEFDAADEIDITLADSTGTADSITINVDNRGGAATDAVIDMSGVETLNLVVLDDDTGNNAAVGLTNADVATVNASGGFAGAVLALGTLDVLTTTVDSTAYKGDISFTGANTNGITFNSGAGTAASAVTLGDGADTATVASTGAIDVDIDGGAGTDVLNLTVTTGFVDAGEIDNFETINLAIAAGVDITLGAATSETNGIDEAAALNVTGGNSLSTFTVGVIGTEVMSTTTLLSVDASAFAGNTKLFYGTDILLATMVLKAGALTTDTLEVAIDAAGSDLTYNTNGFETFTATMATVGRTHTMSLEKMVGLTSLKLGSPANVVFVADEYVSTIQIQIGSAVGSHLDNGSSVDVNLASVSGTSDTLNLKIVDTLDAIGSVDIDAAGVEIVNMVLGTGTESHVLDLAGISATSGSNVAYTITSGNAADSLTISGLHSTVNVLDASGSLSAIVMTGSSGTATTISSGALADTLIMDHKGDALNAGAGADILDINFSAVIGGMAVDLSSAVDQIDTFNGSSNASIQLGFQHADLTGYTGYAAEITANASGSNITGSLQGDAITLAAGADVVTFNQTSNKDTISGFTVNSDTLDMSGITGISAASEVAMSTGATKHAGTDTATYVFASDRDGGVASTITNFTNMTEVATYMTANITAANGENYVAVVNDLSGEDVYVYMISGTNITATGIEAAEVTLIGQLNDIGATPMDIVEIV